MLTSIDKSWMSKHRSSLEYRNGVESFIRFTSDANREVTLFSCPCVRCRNGGGKKDLGVISHHLLQNGINQSYTKWFAHGEYDIETVDQPSIIIDDEQLEGVRHEMEELVHGAYGVIGENADAFMEDIGRTDNVHGESSDFHVNGDRQSRQYKSLLSDAKQPLYSSCSRKHTKLLATVEMYNLKVRNGWSDNSFDDLLKLVKSFLPEENTLPENTHEDKKMIRALGMDYDVIHACSNDCILYWKQYEKEESCPTCHTSRWKPEYLTRDEPKKVPVKVLRHFPLIPRLKRLYSIPWIAQLMTWHAKTTPSAEVMRHPADSPVWTRINSSWPEFSEEARNMRLGLATDGFNPFSHLSSTYSCWPVIIVPYNLPPSYCMRKEFSMLTALIPGPKGPSKDIDIYLQPLVTELKELWRVGVATYDSYSKETFTLKAMLLSTIHDFPAYGSVSGCITQGRYACPVCAEETYAEWLQNGKKFVYQGNRRGLPVNHELRTQKGSFNNKEEHNKFPDRLTGLQVKEKVEGIHMHFGKITGKKRKRYDDESATVTAWYKKSILFELEYWEELKFRHNLDVMHIEKNVADHLLSTIFDVKNKTKDGKKARKDLKRLKLKKNMWLKQQGAKTITPKAPFALGRQEKDLFCRALHDLKVPKGYSSNWKLRVNMGKLEIKGLKSHDHHVIMQQLFPILLQHAFSKQKPLRTAICDISTFFRVLCSKELRAEDLIIAKKRLIEAMCVLEKFFPPSFFVISVHLMVHLADEALACGPVWFRWMYHFERLMKDYKGYVKNFAHPEGCIAERYVIEESILYCMEYMPDGDKGSHKRSHQRYLDESGEFVDEGPVDKGKYIKLTNLEFEQVRRWILHNYEGVDKWKKKYETYVRLVNLDNRRKKGSTSKVKQLDFIPWLRKELEHIKDESTLRQLAEGPAFKAKSYNKYRVNGFLFSSSKYEVQKSTQNSGVCMNAITSYRASARDKNYKEEETTYYGVVRKIIELDYDDFQQTVFYCDWVRVEDRTHGCKVDPDTNLVMVNMEKFKGNDKEDDEPFILASQAKQVFYSRDPLNVGWSTVLNAPKMLTKDVDDPHYAYEENANID